MSLGITQAGLDRFAAQSLALLPSETVTYAGTVDSGSKTGDFLGLTRQQLLDPALLGYRRLRIATSDLADPQARDTVLRSNGELWEVQSPDGGGGRPFWFLLVHQVA